MRLGTGFAILFAAVASSDLICQEDDHMWRAPLKTDRRCPCPYLNTLANHGYLPRNGLNVTLQNMLDAFDQAFNVDPAVTSVPGTAGMTTSTTGNPDTINLDDLDKHGVIEKDASLSRADTITGDNHSFNAAIWNSVAVFFTRNTIPVKNAAVARLARIATAKALNPQLEFGEAQNNVSLAETALYLSIFAEAPSGDANTQWVEVLFRQERIPWEEGFKRPAAPITGALLDVVVEKLRAVGVTFLGS